MTTDEGRVVRCPVCGFWIAKVSSLQANIEVNCTNWNCKTPIVIIREGPSITTIAVPRLKSQQA